MDSIQRLNYFTSQFLVEEDFLDEQAYHREMRHRHNRSLHTPGVVEGLLVSQAGDRQIKVSPGMAIDQNGQEIILLSESGAIPLSGTNDVFVTIQYKEEKEILDTTSGLEKEYRRIQEKSEIAFSTSRPSAEGSTILLASVKLNANGDIEGDPNNLVRMVAGAAIAPKSVGSQKLEDGGVTREKIASKAVNTDQIADNAVTATQIAAKSIGSEQLEDRAITGEKIALQGIINEHIQNGAVNEDKLAQSVKDSIRTSGVIRGMIIMWSGSITSIPQGWALCNGANGTPNLINRFIMGLASDAEAKTGGSQDHAHNTTGPISDVPKTTALGGASFELAGKGHTHNTSTANHLPPFFKLAFIMKL
ncbi:MAG: hypothetical protein WCD18_00090 [Thermosynechococcaceae cyanobacterium]